MKYSPEIVETICHKLATGDHRISDVCQQVGITEQTFYRWKEEKSEFSEALKKAEQDRLAAFATMARSGLAKLLDVYEYEEVTTEYTDQGGEPVIKSRKVTTKRVMPNATAVIFALKNREPEEWKD
ncbi:terminase small subunit-like protein, partial [Hymenobacter crusticola]